LCSPGRAIFGRYQTNNGQILILVGNGYDTNDPKRTFAKIRQPLKKAAAGSCEFRI
jgi:hypothetical protein